MTKKDCEEKINGVLQQIGVNVRLVLDINHAKYIPLITTMPTYQGLVCGYCVLKNYKGRIVPMIIGIPTNLSTTKISILNDMFEKIKEITNECNSYIKKLNVEI